MVKIIVFSIVLPVCCQWFISSFLTNHGGYPVNKAGFVRKLLFHTVVKDFLWLLWVLTCKTCISCRTAGVHFLCFASLCSFAEGFAAILTDLRKCLFSYWLAHLCCLTLAWWKAGGRVKHLHVYNANLQHMSLRKHSLLDRKCHRLSGSSTTNTWYVKKSLIHASMNFHKLLCRLCW